MSAAPREPARAETDPPPGAKLFRDNSSIKSFNDSEDKSSLILITFSIIFSFGSNGTTSFNPRDIIAVAIMSSLGIPKDLFCFLR